jgi:hypothetical protein
MNLVSELDLPAFDYTAPDFSADRYHLQLAEGSSEMSPNHGPAPDVS